MGYMTNCPDVPADSTVNLVLLPAEDDALKVPRFVTEFAYILRPERETNWYPWVAFPVIFHNWLSPLAGAYLAFAHGGDDVLSVYELDITVLVRVEGLGTDGHACHEVCDNECKQTGDAAIHSV